MQELLWNTDDPKVPLGKLEFYQLRLDDLTGRIEWDKDKVASDFFETISAHPMQWIV